MKLCVLGLLAASLVLAQKPPQRPKVHSDFAFAAFPPSREAAQLMAKDKYIYTLVAYHEGWDFEKIGKELKVSDEEVDKIFSDLDTEHLANQTQDGSPRPNIPVFREKDIQAIKASLDKHSNEFAKVVAGSWSQIETAASSLNGAKGVPKEELMYEVVVSGMLLGTMIDVFYEDKTFIPPGPKRGRGQRYYAWLVEGDRKYAGRIQREEGQGDGYTIVTVGPTVTAVRPTLNEIRTGHGLVLDEAESRKLRSVLTIISRDKLLPYLKENRNDFLKVAGQLRAAKYSTFGEFFAWYYVQIVNNAVDEIVESKRMLPPGDLYAYAFKTLQ
jgi:hypothetical protein